MEEAGGVASLQISQQGWNQRDETEPGLQGFRRYVVWGLETRSAAQSTFSHTATGWDPFLCMITVHLAQYLEGPARQPSQGGQECEGRAWAHDPGRGHNHRVGTRPLWGHWTTKLCPFSAQEVSLVRKES